MRLIGLATIVQAKRPNHYTKRMNEKSGPSTLPHNTSSIIEVFDPFCDQPSTIVLLPRGCDPQSVATDLRTGQLLPKPAECLVIRAANEQSLSALGWLYGEWKQSSLSHGSHRLTTLIIPTAMAPVDDNINSILNISDPACFPLAGVFFPSVYRAPEFSIHAHLLRIRTAIQDPEIPKTTGESMVFYAVRWTINNNPEVFFLQSTASIPPGLLKALLLQGSQRLATWSGAVVELAGPASVARIDPRLRCSQWEYSVTIRKKTVALSILVPTTVGRALEELFPPGLAGNMQTYSPDTSLTGLLALNRRLVDRGSEELLQSIDVSTGNALACFVADHAHIFSPHDLTFLVQNYLLPQGIEAILDCFFLRDSYDPRTWARISHVLGQKLSTDLALALKEGKNKNSGLTTESARALLRAISSKRLELGTRGETLINTVLGNAIDGVSRSLLESLLTARIPGSMLERVPAAERMKALANLTDRERSICLYGDRPSILVLMEAFSQKGKQREQDDYDLMLKSVERGDIDLASIVQAKTEASQFIAEHILNTAMAKASDADWRALRSKLKPETLVFLLESPFSCLVDNPLRNKLGKGLAAIELKSIKEKLLSTEKLPGYKATQPALMHRELIELLGNKAIG